MTGRRWLAGLVLAALPLTPNAQTAREVFAQAAPSVVVVVTVDWALKPLSQGSGVAVAAGRVVTNCHVLHGAARVLVREAGEYRTAWLTQADDDRDVCLLDVAGLAARPAHLGSSASLSVGDPVYAIGTPRGLDLTLSEGIVSSFRGQDTERLIQITAPISPGSSGGGLFDAEARLVGLPSFLLRESQQLNFAVPVEWVRAALAPAAAAPPEPPPRRNAPQPPPAAPVKPSPDHSARELSGNQNWQDLLKQAEARVQARPDDPQALIALGVAYYQTGQRGMTTDIYLRLKLLDPDAAEAFFQRYVLP